jgi:hypothetical protein
MIEPDFGLSRDYLVKDKGRGPSHLVMAGPDI